MLTIARLTFSRLNERPFQFLYLLGVGLAWLLRNSQDAGLNMLPVLFPQGQASRPFGVVLLLAMALLLVVFLGAGEIPRDISSRFASLLLSKPLRRWEYVAGRALGVFGLGYAVYASWLVAMFAFAHLAGSATATAPSWGALSDSLLPGFLLAPAACCTVALSCYLEDVPVMICMFVYGVVAYLVTLVPLLSSMTPPVIFYPLMTLYYLFPNPVFYLMPVPSLAATLALVVYSFALSALWVAAALPGFTRRDLP